MDSFRVPIRTRTSDTTEAIRRLLLNGRLPEGSRLKDDELSRALGVSRATVREAMRPLVAQGILTYEPFKGIQVATITEERLADLAEVRIALETLAALNASRVKEESGPILAELLEGMNQARKARDSRAALESHFAFHRQLFQLAGNQILSVMWDDMEVQTRFALVAQQGEKPDFEFIATSHREIRDAILDGDERLIARVMAAHIEASAQNLLRRRRAVEPVAAS